MRDNAPWTDRTGNARNGLKAEHQKQEMRWHQLTLSHSVPYGIWLEVRWSGRYAILNPTLEKIGPELMRTATEAANRAIQLVGEG